MSSRMTPQLSQKDATWKFLAVSNRDCRHPLPVVPGQEMKQIYFDNHATTPTDPRVLEAMLPHFKAQFGNPASLQHSFGWDADRAVESARAEISALLGCTPKEITFTSGGTEGNNLALRGLFESYGPDFHMVTTAVEHKAILEEAKYLEGRGAKVTILPVDPLGFVDPDVLKRALRPDTKLVSLIYGNNEIGTVQRMSELVSVVRNNSSAWVHSDAVQAVGRIPIDLSKLDLDMMTLSAHKIYGPKGVGAFFLRNRSPRLKLSPLFHGGGHERGLRSGTLNVPGIVGLGEACRILRQEMSTEVESIKKLQSQMLRALRERPGLSINGPGGSQGGNLSERLSTNVSVTIENIRSSSLIKTLKGVAFSTGSACSSQSVSPSYVLKAIGLSDEQAVSTIRFGLGRFSTEDEVELTLAQLFEAIDGLGSSSNSLA